MKHFILTLFATLFLFAGNAVALDSCVTGSWYSPERSGEGISIEVTDDLIVAYLYTYGTNWDYWSGAKAYGKQFFIAVGANDGSSLSIHETITTPEWPKPQLNVGDMTLEMDEEGRLLVALDISLDADRMLDPNTAIPWCIGCSSDLVLNRLTQPIPCE